MRQARLGFFTRWIGLSGLCVAGLGIPAVSWMRVRAHTAEIGARRALGATAFDIFFFLILFEAVVISLIGSALGLVAG